MKCKICSKEFQNFLELTTHLVKEHNYKAEDIYKYYNYNFETKEATCPICGKKFKMEGRQVKKYKEGASKGITCGRSCSSTFMNLVYGNPSCRLEVKEKKKQKALEKYGVENVFQAKEVKDKIKQTNLEKYGVEHVMQSPEILEKSKETNLEKYGVKHVSQRKDIKERKVQKSLDKYGVENISQAEEIKEKKKQSALEKYGVEYTLQAPEVREKIKKTNLEKYGVEYIFQSFEIREKCRQAIRDKYGPRIPKVKKNVKETNLKRYGVENVAQIPEIKEKIKQTNLERYGYEYTLQSPEVREKGKKTSLKKYGVEYPTQSSEIKEKTKQTNLERYGVESASQAPEVKKRRKETSIKKYGVPYTIMAEDVKEKARNTFKEKYNVDFFCQHEKCIRAGGKRISNINKEFHEFLEKNGIENELEFIIENHGYDIKVGNTLVEIDPYYTHNITVAPYFKGKERECIPVDYHISKTAFAKEHGYSCIHVFDWDDTNKIVNLLQPKERIYARECTGRTLTKKEAKEFLEKYHLQGSTKSCEFAYGLFYKGELVEVMTFGKPRYNKNYEYELLRLCTVPKFSIVGGASKLLSFFEGQVKPRSLISYCDLSKFNGEVYEKLGFELQEKTQPAIHWYNYKTKRHITDNLLRQRGFDQLHGTNFGKGTSNEELMIKHGYVKIPDCGQLVFVKKY